MKRGRLGVSGALAGAVNGVFGGGGGMVLAPLLGSWCRVEEKRALANCVATILPCCVLSGGVYLLRTGLDWGMALPYLLGGLAGGFLGGKLFTKVPAVWLRRLCGICCEGVCIAPAGRGGLRGAVGLGRRRRDPSAAGDDPGIRGGSDGGPGRCWWKLQ